MWDVGQGLDWIIYTASGVGSILNVDRRCMHGKLKEATWTPC